MKLIAALALSLAARRSAAPVAFVAATPASAADVKTIVCLEQNLDTNARALLDRDLRKNLESAGGAQSYSPEFIAVIQAAAAVCKEKHGWSTEAAQAAILYTLPKLGWPLAARMGRAKGIDPQLLVKHVRELSDAELADATSETVLGKLAHASIDAGEINGENAALGGALYGLLTLQAKAYIDFAKAS